MSNEILALILAVTLVATLVVNMYFAWAERKVARQLSEAFELIQPVMEDIRRIEPHLEESIDFAMVRMVGVKNDLKRLSTGRVTPFGLIPRRKRKGS